MVRHGLDAVSVTDYYLLLVELKRQLVLTEAAIAAMEDLVRSRESDGGNLESVEHGGSGGELKAGAHEFEVPR